MLLSFWFLALLAAGAIVALGCSVALFARRRHRSSHWSGWRSTAVCGGAACLGLTLTFGAVLDGVNRKFSYIPSFAALFGNISPDLTTHAMSAAAASAP